MNSITFVIQLFYLLLIEFSAEITTDNHVCRSIPWGVGSMRVLPLSVRYLSAR